MRIKSILLLLVCFLLSCSFTLPLIACVCNPACTGCQTCEAGVCVNDNDLCDDCESCDDGSCEPDCTTGQCCEDDGCVDDCSSGKCCDDGDCVSSCPTGECCDDGTCVSSCPTGECCDDGTCVSSCLTGECCDGTCCDNCCDGITCYDPATETCCGDGYGTVCSGSFPCCWDVPGSASICTNYCYDSVCCSSGQSCCDNGCCDNPCCGDECCGEGYYCCGNEECCTNDEVCCQNLITGEYYCNPPCSEEVIDTLTCSEFKETFFECPVCTFGLIPPTCIDETWRDYSGLEIEECQDGCQWLLLDEICYEEFKCGGDMKEDHQCIEVASSGNRMCIFSEDPILLTCFECENSTTLIDSHSEETCSCVY